MKNLYFLLVVMVCSCNSSTDSGSAQERAVSRPARPGSADAAEVPCEMPIGNMTEARLEWQWYESSCWAATLSMAAKYLQPTADSLNQCYFVHLQKKQSACGCETNRITADVLTKDTVTLHNAPDPCPGSYVYYSGVYAEDLNKRFEYARHISKNADSMKRALPIQFLSANLDAGLPVMHKYSVGNSTEHVNLLVKSLNVNVPNGGNSMLRLIHVKDPYPQGKGTEYFTTYEQFYLDKKQDNIFFGKRCPALSGTTSTQAYLDNIFSRSGISAKEIVNGFNQQFSGSGRADLNANDLGKMGLSPQTGPLRVHPVYFQVIQVSSDIRWISDTLFVEGMTNTYQFDKEMYFLTDERGVFKTAVSCAKMTRIAAGENVNYKDKWFLSSIENAARYIPAFKTARIKYRKRIPKLVLLKIEGARNLEILVQPFGKSGKFRVIDFVRRDKQMLDVIIE